ncbi:uncharacterized protein JKF63_07960 [Porcisia hertigi]|uniref:Uncharacterized protein n=1 Tax=Porcisia hertigi TaxID=2761500 RepID=A0A836I4Q8_9TRYP|nr:hypothetical protein JKF63_07960 [Porcisia hertigi]
MSALLTASPTGAAATLACLPEENAIVLDKWLYDVCGVEGEEDNLQFPSHRRPQFYPYVERLRRVAKAKQFLANTFEYPSRSGTREVVVLQRMLEALASLQQSVTRDTEEVQDRVRHVQRVLEEKTMGASAIMDEPRVSADRETGASGDKDALTTAAAAATSAQPVSFPTPLCAAHPERHTPSPQQLGYVSLDSVAASGDGGPANSELQEAVIQRTLGGEAHFPVSTKSASSIAPVARDADYEKKRTLSLRYVAELQSKTRDLSTQRAEMEQRHTRLLAELEQLDKEYKALQTTEELVVARHQETESCKEEERRRLSEEAAMYVAEEALFESAWAKCTAASHGEPVVEFSTGETVGGAGELHLSGEASPSSSPGSRTSSPSPPPFSWSAPSHASSIPRLSARSTHDEDPVDAATAAPPDEASLTSASENQSETDREPCGTSSGQIPCGAVSSSTRTIRAPPLQRQALEALRRQLSAIGVRTANCRRKLLNEGKAHRITFHHAQQRLKDWQDVATQLRRTHHQLRGQVDVIHTVLSDTAGRLERGDSTAQRPGYGEQLARFNTLLKERSYEALQYYMGGSGAAATDRLLDASADEELRALQRRTPSKASVSSDMTPARCDSAIASSVATSMHQSPVSRASRSLDNTLQLSSSPHTPVNGAESNGFSVPVTSSNDITLLRGVETPHRHRSRFELVRHLQRWESVLLTERLAILKAAHMVPGPHSGTGVNTKQADGFSATRSYDDLRALLLRPKTHPAV